MKNLNPPPFLKRDKILKKVPWIFLLLFAVVFFSNSTLSAQGSVVINEFIADPGNYDGQGAEWTELYNTTGSDVDLSCWVLTDGEEIIVIPSGTTIPANGYLVIYNSNFFACANCNWDASIFGDLSGGGTPTANGILNANGGASTSFLDLANCNCTNQTAPFAVTWDNGQGDGDRIVLFDDLAVISDAVYSGDGAGGSQMNGGAAIPENSSGYTDAQAGGNVDNGIDILGNATIGCMLPAANDYSLPAISTMEFAGPDEVGCTTSYSRNTDGDETSGWFSDDWPSPGQSNETEDFEIFVVVSGDYTETAPNEFDICGEVEVEFEVEIYGYNRVYEDNDGDNVAGTGTNLEGGSIRGGSNIDGTIDGAAFMDDPWTIDDVDAGITLLISDAYTVSTDACFNLFVKENTQSSGASNTPDGSAVSNIFGSGTAIECYVNETIKFNSVLPLASASFTCDPVTGLVNVTTIPPNAPNATFELLDQPTYTASGGNVVASNTNGTFTVTSTATDNYFVRVLQDPACGGPVEATGTVCVATPLCPSFDNYNALATAGGAICPEETIDLCLEGTNLPAGGTIEWVTLASVADDPYTNALSVIASQTIAPACVEIASNNIYLGAEGQFFAFQDMDGEGASSSQTFTLSGINIAGQTNVSLCIDLAEDAGQGWDVADQFDVDISVDAGANQNLIHVEGTATNSTPVESVTAAPSTVTLTPTFSTFSKMVVATGTSAEIVISMSANSGDEDLAFDNIILKSDENPTGFYILDFDDNLQPFVLSTPQFSDINVSTGSDYFGVVCADAADECVSYTVSTEDCNSSIIIAPRIMPDQTGCMGNGDDPTPTLPAREYTITCPTASIGGETAICEGASTSFEIDFDDYGASFSDVTIVYAINGAAQPAVVATSDPFTVTGITTAGLYTIVSATSADLTLCGLAATGEVTVGLSSNPSIPTGTQSDVCWDGSSAVFLEGVLGDPKLTWYSDMALTTEIGAGTPFGYTPAASGTQTLYVTSKDADSGCESAALEVSFTVNEDPVSNNTTLSVCEDAMGSGQGDFVFADAEDATATSNTGGVDIDNGVSGLTITYHSSFTDASLDQAALTSGNDLMPTTIYARLEDGNNCFSVATVELIVNDEPDVVPVFIDPSCVTDGSITLPSGFNYSLSINSAASTTVTSPIVITAGESVARVYTITVINPTTGCEATEVVNVDAVAGCSACLLNPLLDLNPVCDDNDTPTDPSDDYYSFAIEPDGDDLASTYTISGLPVSTSGTPNQTNGSYNYGAATTFGQYTIGATASTDYTVTVTDGDDTSCSEMFLLTVPETCSDCTNYDAVLSGNPSICSGGEGASSSAEITLTINGGTTAYSVILNDGTSDLAPISVSGTGGITLSPTSTTSYSIVSVTDMEGCVATPSGTATITINEVACPSGAASFPWNGEIVN